MTDRRISILHLYDQYLNIYADRGNMMVLNKRCSWRGIDCDIAGLALDDSFEPGQFDLIYVGGGQDRDQRLIANRMASRVGRQIQASVDSGAALLAVCGGYQLLGHRYVDTSGVEQPGVGMFDHETHAAEGRLIGNVAIECELPAIGRCQARTTTVVGFENHAGRTVLEATAHPLGRVLYGHGNNGHDGYEGCLYRRAVGTYLHGPLLPRNPLLADWLITAALAHRYGDDAVDELEPIDEPLSWIAHAKALQRASAERR